MLVSRYSSKPNPFFAQFRTLIGCQRSTPTVTEQPIESSFVQFWPWIVICIRIRTGSIWELISSRCTSITDNRPVVAQAHHRFPSLIHRDHDCWTMRNECMSYFDDDCQQNSNWVWKLSNYSGNLWMKFILKVCTIPNKVCVLCKVFKHEVSSNLFCKTSESFLPFCRIFWNFPNLQ